VKNQRKINRSINYKGGMRIMQEEHSNTAVDESTGETEKAKLDPAYDMINNNFVYHPPKDGQVEKYAELRDQARRLALRFVSHCPASRERSLAITKLEEAIMWANAAIARNE
jgi:hypothetical protein